LSSPPSALLANNLLPCHPRLKKLTWVVNHALLDQRSLSPPAISMASIPFRALFVELTLSITPCLESGANDDGSQLNLKDFTSLRILKVHDCLLGRCIITIPTWIVFVENGIVYLSLPLFGRVCR
jgi:hypothetical protein